MRKTENRWRIVDGGIEWDIEHDHRLPHEDHVEMSGMKVSVIINYGVKADGSLLLQRHPIWPDLRTIPNNTHASFQTDITNEELPCIELTGSQLIEIPHSIRFDGILTIRSMAGKNLEICRELFPSVNSRAIMERIRLSNKDGAPISLEIRQGTDSKPKRGCMGIYLVDNRIFPEGEIVLASGESRTFSLISSARIANEPYEQLDINAELLRRRARIEEITAPLILSTGIPEIDTAFHFAKLRAGESIFRTRGGLMHSPGGGAFYAATWCNDQVEYAGPWFAFTGDAVAQEASLNAYFHYMPFMGPDFMPIPSSVIAEGFDIWDGAGDRGDAAMYAYGASRFALASGNRVIAAELWPAIEWTLEYCRRKLTPDGVVASDTDELEGRLPAGNTNLCTSSLYYGGLRSASFLASELGLHDASKHYAAQADKLSMNLETYFGRNIQGFETYRYYEENDILRSWICVPLCMGIFKRTQGTIDAMFSPRLWTENGMLSQESDNIFWDRSTLYGLRGALIAGATDRGFQKLKEYSVRRLLGEHVPYAVEAWPEHGQKHLSAESALYCRVITEGLFGIEPVGLHAFKFTPRLPADCAKMSLCDVRGFGHQFDLIVERAGLRVESAGRIIWSGTSGEVVSLSGKLSKQSN